MLRNKCEGKEFSIHFRKTQQFIFEVILKVCKLVFRFMWKIKKFYEAAKSYISALCEKNCQRLLDVFGGEPVSHCIVSFLTLPSASWIKRTCPYHHLSHANSYFSVNNVNLVEKLSLPPSPELSIRFLQLQSILHNIFFTTIWRDIKNLVFSTVFKNQPWYRMILRETFTWLDSSILK